MEECEAVVYLRTWIEVLIKVIIVKSIDAMDLAELKEKESMYAPKSYMTKCLIGTVYLINCIVM